MTLPPAMARALALARGQLGRTAPNPAVGCVLERDGAILAEGATGDGGRPHAEETALLVAGPRAAGATAYVTLEPCNQRSTTAASCTDRLIAAGVSQVIYAADDPHPNAAGAGPKRLEAAGVAVTAGVGAREAQALYRAFAHRVRTGAPLVEISAVAGPPFEGELHLQPGETLGQALARLAAAGVSHAFARPGSAAAQALQAAAD